MVAKTFRVIKHTVVAVFDDRVLTFAAAIAFYTALSMPPLLVLLVWLLGHLGRDAEDHLRTQATALMGENAGTLIDSILASSDKHVSLNSVSGWIGLGVLLFAASGVFSQLQAALNAVWQVEARAGGGVVQWLRRRFLSLGVVGVLAFLAAVSLSASTLLIALGLSGRSGTLGHIAEVAVPLVVFTLVFAAVFKLLPAVHLSWRDVLGGALVTAVLFEVGKHVIGSYLAKHGIGSDYGAAGSAIAALAWVYLSGAVLLIGAELTRFWLRESGRQIEPNQHGMRVKPSA